jgi:hypothetical protein
MEQHQIPQQISSYQFRLVGDMTLKQFFQVGGGALIAILLYSSGLPVFIKWPLLVLSFVLGLALAFFPLEDRPLSKWIVLFAKSIYAPTLYVWMKNPSTPSYFQPEGTVVPDAIPVGPQTAAIATPPQVVALAPELEKSEQQFLEKVDDQLQATATEPASPLPSPASFPAEPIVVQPERPNVEELTIPIRTDVKMPESSPIQIENSDKTQDLLNIPQDTLMSVQQQAAPTDYQVSPMAGQQLQTTALAQFSPDAAPPSPPTRENVIVGQVMDSKGGIAENAILEIKDEEGRPVRALKSNKLGHFMIVTPLLNGKYEISTEKDGMEFDPLTIEANGQIIPPIAIRAKHE